MTLRLILPGLVDRAASGGQPVQVHYHKQNRETLCEMQMFCFFVSLFVASHFSGAPEEIGHYVI